MDAEWKWLCYEWQGRGSIHAHGCAKLKNDPGLCDLVKTAAHGLKLQKVLDVEQDEPNYEEIGHDFTPAIEARVQAQARVIQYADSLPTTMNDSLPDENWTIPNQGTRKQQMKMMTTTLWLTQFNAIPVPAQHIAYVSIQDNYHRAESIIQRIAQSKQAFNFNSFRREIMKDRR